MCASDQASQVWVLLCSAMLSFHSTFVSPQWTTFLLSVHWHPWVFILSPGWVTSDCRKRFADLEILLWRNGVSSTHYSYVLSHTVELDWIGSDHFCSFCAFIDFYFLKILRMSGIWSFINIPSISIRIKLFYLCSETISCSVWAAGVNQLQVAVAPLPFVSSRGSPAITFDRTELGSAASLLCLPSPPLAHKPINTTC